MENEEFYVFDDADAEDEYRPPVAPTKPVNFGGRPAGKAVKNENSVSVKKQLVTAADNVMRKNRKKLEQWLQNMIDDGNFKDFCKVILPYLPKIDPEPPKKAALITEEIINPDVLKHLTVAE